MSKTRLSTSSIGIDNFRSIFQIQTTLGNWKKIEKFLKISLELMGPKRVSRSPLSIGIVDILAIWYYFLS